VAHTGVAWLHFQELCENPLGAADFFALCKSFHTVAVGAGSLSLGQPGGLRHTAL